MHKPGSSYYALIKAVLSLPIKATLPPSSPVVCYVAAPEHEAQATTPMAMARDGNIARNSEVGFHVSACCAVARMPRSIAGARPGVLRSGSLGPSPDSHFPDRSVLAKADGNMELTAIASYIYFLMPRPGGFLACANCLCNRNSRSRPPHPAVASREEVRAWYAQVCWSPFQPEFSAWELTHIDDARMPCRCPRRPSGTSRGDLDTLPPGRWPVSMESWSEGAIQILPRRVQIAHGWPYA